MLKNYIYSINIDEQTHEFFNDIAKITKRPIEDVLSDALYKYIDMVYKVYESEKQ